MNWVDSDSKGGRVMINDGCLDAEVMQWPVGGGVES